MITDDVYELCQPVLEDKDLEEEDKIEKLEELLRKETTLDGSALENTILDALWRHRNASKPGAGEAPSRHLVVLLLLLAFPHDRASADKSHRRPLHSHLHDHHPDSLLRSPSLIVPT
jgi:hypothetical protein